MKKLFFALLTLVMAGAIESCEKQINEEVIPPQDEPISEPATSHIEMYVTSEYRGWNKTLFSTDKLGEWWKPTGYKFYLGQATNGVNQFFLKRGNLEYDNTNHIPAFVEFCINFPADIPIVVGTKYYFGEIKDRSRLFHGVIIEDPSSSMTNFIELKTAIFDFVSTSGWIEFSMIDKATIDGRDVYALDMTFGFKGIDKTRGEATCEVSIGRVTNNPGECSAPLYYWTESGYVAETAIVEHLVSECNNFDDEALVASLNGKWTPDSLLIYDEEWANITTPLLVMGVDYADGRAYSYLTFAEDGTGAYYNNFPEPDMEPETREFSWTYDADSNQLTLTGEYNNEWNVRGYSNDYIILDQVSREGWNYRTILKRIDY